jgi:pimeloyl-ACP methyl ester carboxylesterase
MGRMRAWILAIVMVGLLGCRTTTTVQRCAVTSVEPSQLTQVERDKLVEQAFRNRAIHPQHGWKLNTPNGEVIVPVSYHGLVWDPAEVAGFLPTCEIDVKKYLKHHHRTAGVGVPVVGLSQDVGLRPAMAKFHPQPRPMTLTAYLRTSPTLALELYETTHIQTVTDNGMSLVLAKDLSAPIAYLAQQSKEAGTDKRFLAAFKTPTGKPDEDRLIALEPYRPGVHPVMFIHGARSDNLTWLDTVNDLRTDPEFTKNFQGMTFRYETGTAYLFSAMHLRQLTTEFVEAADPTGTDTKFRQWAMVGYSLGGPVLRMAVTSSGDTLWNAFSSRPLDEMNMDETYRQLMRRMFFFEPLPFVKTAIFIASPFDGGTVVSNTMFRIGANFIRYPENVKANFENMVRNNPGAIRPEAAARVPTSLDLLQADSWLTNAMRELPFGPDVQLHTIIGNGGPTPLSDRLVPVRSARIPNSTSETIIPMLHKNATWDPRSIERQRQLLQEHIDRYK